jgi:hypothetical protein
VTIRSRGAELPEGASKGSTATGWNFNFGENAKVYLPHEVAQQMLLPPDLRAHSLI